MLLLLFGGGPPDPAIPISAAVTTAPVATHGYRIDRPATSGVWRLALELGDPAAGDAFTWFDVSEFYAGDAYQRGADDYLGKYRAAVAQVQLQTDNDDLAPWGQDTSALFGVDVPLDAGLLMRLGMIRVVSGVVEEWEPLWTGRVETWGDASAARGQIRTHVVTVVDTISDLANVITIIELNAVPISEWLTDNLEQARWLFGVDFYGDDPPLMPIDETPTAAITRMDQAADPNGLVWRSRRNGRLVVYPAPWDTVNVDRWSNPLLDVYPSGLVFSFSPDFTDIAYIDDDDQQPFGISRTSLGVLNTFTVTTPSDLYLLDDPVSVSRYGVRPFTATWIVNAVEQVVQDLVDARAYSSPQALPLRTSLDHEGFWSAMALVDHLDPVTIIHATTDDGPVVTGTGVVRNVTEQRTVRGVGDDGVSLISWQSTVQIDLDATDTSPALLPVEDLALVATNTPLLGGPSSAQFSWTNPTQPDITPTDVQVRLLPSSFIWNDIDYPGVGADGTTFGYLSAATSYTLQVRLIRRVGGIITAFSATRSVRFTTPALIVPVITPGDGGDDGTNVGIPPDFGCDTEWHIEENDGTGWSVFMSGDQNDLVLGADGLYHLPVDIDNGDFDPAKIYRVCYRVDCGDGFGPWICGAPSTIPDDWTDPCTTPPALSDPPFDDPSLLVYVPKICAPDIIREAVSGIEAVHGPALAGIVQMFGVPDSFALQAIADPYWSDAPGGILAYGECPQIVGQTGDKSLTIRTNVVNADYCVLGECSAMRITCTPDVGGWKAGGYVVSPTGDQVCLSGVLTEGTEYVITASYDSTTGELTLYVDAAEVNSVSFGGARDTVEALPIWRVGAPPESWVTDFAMFASVLNPATGSCVTGGTETDLGGYRYHTFTTSGTLNVSCPTAVEYLVVGGGGGGGSGTAGGGGAGEFKSGSTTLITTQTITVGAGGAGGTGGAAGAGGANGSNGGASSLGAVATASGGGGGGWNGANGSSGASGGGGGAGATTGGSGGTGGNNGGAAAGAPDFSCGGGGGAGAVGANGVNGSFIGAAGGAGLEWPTGSGVFYAGGGGGGAFNGGGGAGGTGGGGNGSGGSGVNNSGTGGTLGTSGKGGGGGGAGGNSANPSGGGSGVVIVRYPFP